MLRSLLVAALLLGNAPAGRAEDAAQEQDFALIGLHEMRVGTHARLRTGSVALCGPAALPATVGTGARLADGTLIAAPSVLVMTGASVFDVQAGDLQLMPGATVRGAADTTAAPALPFCQPVAPLDVKPGSATVVVPHDLSLTIMPGAYYKIIVQERASLVLEGGRYDVRDVTLLNGAALRAAGPIDLRIANKLKTGVQSFIGPLPESGIGADQIAINVIGTRVYAGPKTRLIGRILAPAAKVTVGDVATLEGQVLGDRVRVLNRCSASRCGNGEINPGEECDGADADTCSGHCLASCRCEDDVPTPTPTPSPTPGPSGTPVEPPTPTPTPAPTPTPRIPTCGDGVLDPPGEECDDGNLANDDGCSSTCRLAAGDFCSFTQGGWSAPCSGSNPGCRRDAGFATAFPTGLRLGDPSGPDGPTSGWTALFNSATAIDAFLPAGDRPAPLDADHVDPLSTAAGNLAGQLVAAHLNLGIAGLPADLEFVACVDESLEGLTVGEIVDLADLVVSGQIVPDGPSPSDLTTALTALNENFDNCKVNRGCLGR